MRSAFFISFCGVFCVFLANPWVATTNDLSSLSQKANSLYAPFPYSVLNSHISEPLNFLNRLLFLNPLLTNVIFSAIFPRTASGNSTRKSMASCKYITSISFIPKRHFLTKLFIPQPTGANFRRRSSHVRFLLCRLHSIPYTLVHRFYTY